MDKFVLRLNKAKKAIDEADHIIIGAGAGLSTADRKSTRLNSSHRCTSRMPSSA